MSGYEPLKKRNMSDISLKKTAYFVPPIPEWRPLKHGFNSSLRIACILDDYLYDGLRFEGVLLPLTESNWKAVIDYGSADFLLVNSFIESATGDWHFAQIGVLEKNSILASLLAFAKSKRIPTVFWFTKDHSYHAHFKYISSLFDYVFCADPEEIILLLAEGVKSDLLLPCVQPALYNPFRNYCDYHAIDIEVVVDGWADLDRFPSHVEQLSSLLESGSLKIIESNYVITKNRVGASVETRGHTLGYVSSKMKQSILKYAKLFLGLTPSIQDETERMWSYLAVAASRVCILHQGGRLRAPVFESLVHQVHGTTDLEAKIRWFEIDPLMREKYAHLAWREVNLKHTFSHRLQKICSVIGVEHNWEEYPKASAIFPTYRLNNLDRCKDTYLRQLYPNMEFILVLNVDENIDDVSNGRLDMIPDPVVLRMPRNCFAGDCINYGVGASKGEYVFRIDDDDYYSEHYIVDRMLIYRAVDLDFLANPQTFFLYFDKDNATYLRKTKSPPFAINPPGELPVMFTGNTFSGKKQLFDASPFLGNNYSAADAYFLDNLPRDAITGSADYFNMAAERRVDQSTHTWRVESQDKLKSEEAVFVHFECVAC